MEPHVVFVNMGGILTVVEHDGGRLGAEPADVAQQRSLSGMDLVVTVGTVVVGILALAVGGFFHDRGSPVPNPGSTTTAEEEHRFGQDPIEASKPLRGRRLD